MEHCLKEEIYLKYFSFINPFFKDVKYLTESSVEGDNLVKENDINEVFLLLPLCQYSELPSAFSVLPPVVLHSPVVRNLNKLFLKSVFYRNLNKSLSSPLLPFASKS